MNNFEIIWEIYQEAFPEDERRSSEQQRELMKDKLYTLEGIYHDNKLLGFIAYWDLINFIYVDHLALSKKFRGKGFGSKFLKTFIEKCNKPIILEVERSETEIAKRRIEFYKKLGFKLNTFEYWQPAYSKEKDDVLLYLMSYPDELTKDYFLQVKNSLYKIVYKQHDSVR